MRMSDKSVIEQIKHYQRDIVKCPENSNRMIRCIERLMVLPVTVAHLQETGVGRAVNELRKYGGEVGAAANALVCKWKCMVRDEEEESAAESEADINEPTSKKTSSPDHRNGPLRNESPHKIKTSTRQEDKISTNRDSESKKSDKFNNDDRSFKYSETKSSSESDHKLYRDKSKNSVYSPKRDSKYRSSHESKTENREQSHKNYTSAHSSEPNSNGSSYTNEKGSMRPKPEHKFHSSKSLDRSKNQQIKFNKEKQKSKENSNKYTSSKKIETKEENFDFSDSDNNSCSSLNRKRKISRSSEEGVHKKSYKKDSSREHFKNRPEDRSSDGSESTNESKHYKNRHLATSDEDSEEASGKSCGEDNITNNQSNSDSKSSGDESEDSQGNVLKKESSSEEEEEEEEKEQSSSSEEETYVQVKIKREKKSPERGTSSYKKEHNKILQKKGIQNISSNSKIKRESQNESKREENYKDIKIKQEKIENDKLNKIEKHSHSSSDRKHSKSNSSGSSRKESQLNIAESKVKVKLEKGEDGSIDCESGASFGDALLGLSETKQKSKRKPIQGTSQEKPSKSKSSTLPKEKRSNKLATNSTPSSSMQTQPYKEPDLLKKSVKLEPLDVDLKATLPEISPHYKPLPHYSPPSSPASKRTKHMSQDEALSSIMSTKNQRTKVYSGNKSGYAKVPSLFDLCIQILRDNIEALEYTGGVPYDLLKPVLDRATADQLYQLEHYNPYLVEDTDGLWKFHCSKDFRGNKPDEFETWRELYLRCLDEREKKLEALKTNITQSMAKSTPVRRTKLAYVDSVVKPPRNVAKQQVKFGTAKAVKHELVAKAMVGAASSSPAPQVVSVPAPSRSNLSNSSFPIPNFLKKKKAPLMAKALQLIKGNRFKR